MHSEPPDLVAAAKHQFYLQTTRRAFDQLVENTLDTCVSVLHASPNISRDYLRGVADFDAHSTARAA